MMYYLETIAADPEGLPPGSALTVQLPGNLVTLEWWPDKATESGLIATGTEHEVSDPRQLDALEEAYDVLSNGVWEHGGKLSEELASRIATTLSASWGGDGQAI